MYFKYYSYYTLLIPFYGAISNEMELRNYWKIAVLISIRCIYRVRRYVHKIIKSQLK